MWLVPDLVGCQALIFTETAGCWWVGLGHKVTGYAALVPQASAGPLVSETGFQSQRLRGLENWI